MEVATALREKTSSFTVRDIGSLAAILDAHNNKCPLPSVHPTDIVNIQSDAFELLMRQLDYDVRAFKVWQGKMSNYESVRPECLKDAAL